MLYKCKRCGFTSDQKNGLRRHLNKKTLCKPLIMDIEVDTLKYDLEEKCVILTPFESKLNPTKSNQFNSKSKYTCSYCSKSYSTSSNMCKHMKICKIKAEVKAEKDKIENNKIAVLEAEIAQKEAEIIEKEKQREAEIAQKEAEIAQREAEIQAEIALKEKERIAEMAVKEAEIALIKQQMELLINHTKEEMEKQKEFLMNHIETLMKHAGNNNNNINNNNTTNNDNSTNIDKQEINIHINGFGNEDTSYITDKHFRHWFNGPFSAITNCIEIIHFNPKKPQNWNTKIVDDKTSKALIYNAEKEMWVKREKKEIINRMVEKSYNMLDSNFEIQKEANTLDEKGKKKFENFMKIYDTGNKQLDKRYETEVREMLLNHKEYHIETY